MLTKLADYYDQQVAPRYPGYDPKADPALGDGNWRPWRKSEDELQDLSVEERDAYMNETHALFTHIDTSERRKLALAKQAAEQQLERIDEGPPANLYHPSFNSKWAQLVLIENHQERLSWS